MEVITVQTDGRCKQCSIELPKGIEAVLDGGFIFCFKDSDTGEDATCHEEYIEAESEVFNHKLL